MTFEERIYEAKCAFKSCQERPSWPAYSKFDNIAKGVQFHEIGLSPTEVNELWLKVQAVEEAKTLVQQCCAEHRWGDYDELTGLMALYNFKPEDIGETTESMQQVEAACKSN